MGWLARIRRVGRIVEPAPAPPAPATPPEAATPSDGSDVAALRGSLHLRHVDAGSCNGCEIEISGAFSPTYDAERFGARLVASPRHADALLVTGAVTRNMEQPLRNTYAAVPRPRLVIAVGDCARNCGVFAGGHGVVGPVSDVVPVDLEIPGCPPTPQQIIDGLRSVTRR